MKLFLTFIKYPDNKTWKTPAVGPFDTTDLFFRCSSQVVIQGSDDIANRAIDLLKEIYTNLGPKLQVNQVLQLFYLSGRQQVVMVEALTLTRLFLRRLRFTKTSSSRALTV